MKKKHAFPYIYLTVITVFSFIPIAVTIIYSFNVSKITSVWGGWTLDWYRELFRDKDLFRALVNSLQLSLYACLISAVIGTMGALGMRKVKGPFADKVNGVVSYISRLPIMTPEIILGMLYLAVFSFMGLPFGMLTLVIAHVSFCTPYVFMMVSDRLIGMDPSIEEAARDLGAKPVRVFADVTFPAILPGILSGLLLSFAMSFDDVVISIFVTGSSINTLPIKIYTRMKTGVTPEINALATIMVGVTILLLVISRIYSRRHKTS